MTQTSMEWVSRVYMPVAGMEVTPRPSFEIIVRAISSGLSVMTRNSIAEWNPL